MRMDWKREGRGGEGREERRACPSGIMTLTLLNCAMIYVAVTGTGGGAGAGAAGVRLDVSKGECERENEAGGPTAVFAVGLREW